MRLSYLFLILLSTASNFLIWWNKVSVQQDILNPILCGGISGVSDVNSDVRDVKRKRVFLYQARGSPPCTLEWMYGPITNTIERLFHKHGNGKVEYQVSKYFIDSSDHSDSGADSSDESTFNKEESSFNHLTSNDIVIFIGNRDRLKIPWKRLQRERKRQGGGGEKGSPYLIYYNTEHIQYQMESQGGESEFKSIFADEIWDYAIANKDYIEKNKGLLEIGKTVKKVRFIGPMGTMDEDDSDGSSVSNREGNTGQSENKNSRCPPPIFLGKQKWRNECWEQFMRHFNSTGSSGATSPGVKSTGVKVIGDACSKESFRNVLENTEVVLNIHKKCGIGIQYQPTEGVRFQQVLNGVGDRLVRPPPLIISQRSYGKDEEHFDGVVDFVEDFAAMRRAYDEFCEEDAEERMNIRKERWRKFQKLGEKTVEEFRRFEEQFLESIGGWT